MKKTAFLLVLITLLLAVAQASAMSNSVKVAPITDEYWRISVDGGEIGSVNIANVSGNQMLTVIVWYSSEFYYWNSWKIFLNDDVIATGVYTNYDAAYFVANHWWKNGGKQNYEAKLADAAARAKEQALMLTPEFALKNVEAALSEYKIDAVFKESKSNLSSREIKGITISDVAYSNMEYPNVFQGAFEISGDASQLGSGSISMKELVSSDGKIVFSDIAWSRGNSKLQSNQVVQVIEKIYGMSKESVGGYRMIDAENYYVFYKSDEDHVTAQLTYKQYFSNHSQIPMPISPIDSDEQILRTATMLSELKKYGQSDALCNTLIGKNLFSTDLYTLSAKNKYEEGNTQEAYNLVMQALKIDPTNKIAIALKLNCVYKLQQESIIKKSFDFQQPSENNDVGLQKSSKVMADSQLNDSPSKLNDSLRG
ncbi:MAG: hypothetical protein WCP79_11180 [Bacillota bacterium]